MALDLGQPPGPARRRLTGLLRPRQRLQLQPLRPGLFNPNRRLALEPPYDHHRDRRYFSIRTVSRDTRPATRTRTLGGMRSAMGRRGLACDGLSLAQVTASATCSAVIAGVTGQDLSQVVPVVNA